MPETRWNAFAEQALAGKPLRSEQALEILAAPDEELIDLLAAAFRVRRHYFGTRVRLNFLVNAKSGHCGEDCGYCSQSRVSTADIPRYQLISKEELVQAAERALELKASTCCIVTSARKPSARELRGVAEAAEEIKERHPDLKLCACLGEISVRAGRGAQGVGHRPLQPQPEHGREPLSGDLHDAHPRRPGANGRDRRPGPASLPAPA